MTDLDLFCGAGGASEGMRRAGAPPVGYEKWALAARSHEANGHPTVCADLSTHDWTGHPPVRLMWASPPCQPFSAAGDQEGEFDDRDGIPWWLRAVTELRPQIMVMENVRGLTFEKHSAYLSGVLASVRALGYELDWRVLDAADYGVPQNRERFILIARRDGGPLAWPAVTHTEGGGLFTLPWVTMADALGRSMDRPYLTVAPGTKNGGADAAFIGGSGARRMLRRGMLNTGRDWKLGGSRDDAQTVDPTLRPSPSVTGIAVTQWQFRDWCWERPATAIMGDPRVFQPGGHHQPGEQSQNAIRVEVWEAAVLQGFPPDYVFCGGRTDQATQVGNAVPPPLAEAIVRALLREQ